MIIVISPLLIQWRQYCRANMISRSSRFWVVYRFCVRSSFLLKYATEYSIRLSLCMRDCKIIMLTHIMLALDFIIIGRV
jgi:hypothetical protein